MRFANRLLAALLALAPGLVVSVASASNGCGPGQGDDGTDVSTIVLQCASHHSGSSSAPGLAAGAMQRTTASAVRYTYVWVPTCPGASPTDPNIAEMDCRAAHSCVNPKLISMSLYALQLTGKNGQPVNGGWSYLGSECRNPKDAGPTQQPRLLTWTDVLSAIRQVGVPGASVKSPAYTLVNLKTTFYTDPATIDRPLTIIGYNVDVHVKPSTYTWHWGDGSTETTDTPGRPYPSTDVTHTYVHATDPGHVLQLSVDVTYTARYQVDGGDWQDIPETLTIAGQPEPLPVKQASAVLVAGH